MAIPAEEIQMANKYMARCLRSPVFTEIQYKMNYVKYNNDWQKWINLVSSFGEDEEN